MGKKRFEIIWWYQVGSWGNPNLGKKMTTVSSLDEAVRWCCKSLVANENEATHYCIRRGRRKEWVVGISDWEDLEFYHVRNREGGNYEAHGGWRFPFPPYSFSSPNEDPETS